MIRLRDLLWSFFIHLLVLSGLAGLIKLYAHSIPKYVEIDLSLANFSSSSSGLKGKKGTGAKVKSKSLKTGKIQTSKKFRVAKVKISKKVSHVFKKTHILKEKKPEKIIPEKKPTIKKETKIVKPVSTENKIPPSEKVISNKAQSKNVAMLKGYKSEKTFGTEGEEGTSVKKGGTGKGNGMGKRGNGTTSENPGKRYLLEKLSIISKIVQRNIHYPYIARRMGWEGKVIISFILTKEGKISLLTVEKSSGYEILDKNAIETIKRVSKYFPLPPLDVKIRLPISYRLE